MKREGHHAVDLASGNDTVSSHFEHKVCFGVHAPFGRRVQSLVGKEC